MNKAKESLQNEWLFYILYRVVKNGAECSTPPDGVLFVLRKAVFGYSVPVFQPDISLLCKGEVQYILLS